MVLHGFLFVSRCIDGITMVDEFLYSFARRDATFVHKISVCNASLQYAQARAYILHFTVEIERYVAY